MSIAVTLGGLEYAAPRLNLGQIRRYVKMLDEFAKRESADRMALFEHEFAVSALCFERVEPKIADLDALEATIAELARARDAVLEASGLRILAPGEGEAAPAA